MAKNVTVQEIYCSSTKSKGLQYLQSMSAENCRIKYMFVCGNYLLREIFINFGLLLDCDVRHFG